MSDDQVAVPPPSPRTEERKHICEWLWSFEGFTDEQHENLEQGIVATLNAERAKAEAREAALERAARALLQRLMEPTPEYAEGTPQPQLEPWADEAEGLARLLDASPAVVAHRQSTSPAEPLHPEAGEAGENPVGLGATVPSREALERALRTALEHTDCHCAACDVDSVALLDASQPVKP